MNLIKKLAYETFIENSTRQVIVQHRIVRSNSRVATMPPPQKRQH
ncbi:MAG: hypothetical protein WCH34_10835 [Bacteroidota bacterium]